MEERRRRTSLTYAFPTRGLELTPTAAQTVPLRRALARTQTPAHAHLRLDAAVDPPWRSGHGISVAWTRRSPLSKRITWEPCAQTPTSDTLNSRSRRTRPSRRPWPPYPARHRSHRQAGQASRGPHRRGMVTPTLQRRSGPRTISNPRTFPCGHYRPYRFPPSRRHPWMSYRYPIAQKQERRSPRSYLLNRWDTAWGPPAYGGSAARAARTSPSSPKRTLTTDHGVNGPRKTEHQLTGRGR